MTDQQNEKVRENRLRRAADRQGYMLVKSRRRDPLALDYGKYVLVSGKAGNRVGQRGGQEAISMFAEGDGMTLDEVSTFLVGERLERNMEADVSDIV